MPRFIVPAFIVVSAEDIYSADGIASDLQQKANHGNRDEVDGYVVLDEKIPTIQLPPHDIALSLLDYLTIAPK